MRQRIRAGMSEAQVTRLLGGPFFVRTSTPPGDVPGCADLCEGYEGQDGPVFVYYCWGKGAEVVRYADTRQTDQAFDYTDG